MPRNYISKGKRGLWSEEQMKLAVADVVHHGTSVKQSASVHGVPRLTLRRHVQKALKGFENHPMTYIL